MTSVSLLDWKIDPCAHELVAQLVGVDQIAVVADGDLTVRAIDQNRLRVGEPAFAGGRIADVSDGDVTWQLRRASARRRRPRRSPSPRHADLAAVGGGDARALLTAMLQRVQAEVGHVGGFGMTEDAEDAALVFELVQHAGSILTRRHDIKEAAAPTCHDV